MNKEKDFIASIHKAVKIIETFTEDNTLQSVQELCDKTGYAKTTVHRILQTLIYEGWMLQEPYSKRYGLGYGLLGYEELIMINESLIKVCDPVMREFSRVFNETVSLAVIERTYGRCIHKVESEHHIKLTSRIGKTMPLYAGATAKCMLAFQSDEYIEEYLSSTELTKFTRNTEVNIEKLKLQLAEIRENRYSVSESEIDMDTFTVSGPIFRRDSQLLCCLSISCPLYRYSPEKENEMIQWMRKATVEIENKIKGRDY